MSTSERRVRAVAWKSDVNRRGVRSSGPPGTARPSANCTFVASVLASSSTRRDIRSALFTPACRAVSPRSNSEASRVGSVTGIVFPDTRSNTLPPVMHGGVAVGGMWITTTGFPLVVLNSRTRRPSGYGTTPPLTITSVTSLGGSPFGNVAPLSAQESSGSRSTPRTR